MTYSAVTREHFNKATGAGVLVGAGVGRGAAGSRAQGTWVQFDVQVDDGSAGPPRIAAACFLAYGCPHTIAVADWIVGRAAGRIAVLALPEDARALQGRFDVPVEKLGRLLIVEDAWVAAVTAAVAARVSARNAT
jgi:NifU-like protein involved in Fe-S cluster formation